MNKGQIHIYTGDGKGKTTAALGLALRALGANKKVAIIQFIKKGNYSEHKAIKKYQLPISIQSFGIGFYKIKGDTHTKIQHQKAGQKALNRAGEFLKSRDYNLVILDEINVAIDLGLIDIDDVLKIIKEKLPLTEIVLTGRKAHSKLLALADLVTEMKGKKHYFTKGVKARRGIEF